MGWIVSKSPMVDRPDAFMLASDDSRTLRQVLFDNEADSHAAGEAARTYLKRPRVSELMAAKEELEGKVARLEQDIRNQGKRIQDEFDRAEGLQRQLTALRHGLPAKKVGSKEKGP